MTLYLFLAFAIGVAIWRHHPRVLAWLSISLVLTVILPLTPPMQAMGGGITAAIIQRILHKDITQ